MDRRAYLRTYRALDLCLDTIPFNGATTHLDALWMGTPTLTLAGTTPVGRAGLHICRQVGFSHLAARTAEEFVATAVDLAGDLGRLTTLRANVQSTLNASSLMDVSKRVTELEGAYRKAWVAWCSERD